MSNRETNQAQLTRLWALGTALSGLPTDKAKGIHLQQACRRDIWIVRYLRASYDYTRNYGFTHEDAMLTCCFGTKQHKPADYVLPTVTGLLKQIAQGDFDEQQAKIQWGLMLEAVKTPECIKVASTVINHRLFGDVPLRVVNRVLLNLELEQIPVTEDPNKDPRLAGRDLSGIVMELVPTVIPGGMSRAAVFVDWNRVGDLYLEVGPHGRKLLDHLRQSGIKVKAVKGYDA